MLAITAISNNGDYCVPSTTSAINFLLASSNYFHFTDQNTKALEAKGLDSLTMKVNTVYTQRAPEPSLMQLSTGPPSLWPTLMSVGLNPGGTGGGTHAECLLLSSFYCTDEQMEAQRGLVDYPRDSSEDSTSGPPFYIIFLITFLLKPLDRENKTIVIMATAVAKV